MKKKKDKPGDWHHRWWCLCGHNYEALYLLQNLQPMCPECGRPKERLEVFKGRWLKSGGNTGWTKEDFEVWVDPDTPEKSESISLFKKLVQRFKNTDLKEPTGPIRKDVMASPVFVEPEEEEEEEKEEMELAKKPRVEMHRKSDPVTYELLNTDWRANRRKGERGKTRVVHVPVKTMDRIKKHCKAKEVGMGRFTEGILKWYLDQHNL